MDPKDTDDLERSLKEYKEKPAQRAFLMETRTVDEDERTVELAFSSEEPYRRWFGEEILDHSPEAIDLSRMEQGGAMLVDHNWSDHVGVVEEIRIDSDRRGRAVVRFGRSQRATEIFNDVVDGIRRNVSVGYAVNEMKLEKEVEEGPDVYRVTRWTPHEISLVAVPADTSVGVGRSLEIPELEIKEATIMDPKETPVVDVTAERNQAIEAERIRVNDLLATGREFGATDLAEKAITEGKNVDDLNRQILERGGFAATQSESPELGLTEKEIKQFSFAKAMHALANPQDQAAQRNAAFEMEVSSAACEKLRRESRGFFVPHEVLQRDLTVGVAADGGDLVATDLLAGSFIERLENMLAIRQAGATMLTGLNGNIAIPRQTGGATGYWLAENGAPTESNPTFDQVALTPKTVGAFTELSRKLLLQGSIGVEQFIQNELALRLALTMDAAAINGTGASNQPKGILNVTGIGAVAGGTNGAAPTWGNVVDLETAVSQDNALLGNLKYLSNAKVRGKLKQTEKAANTAQFVWDGNQVNGYDVVTSNQVPSDLVKGTSGAVCSAAIFGNFADLIIGMWGGLDIQVNPYSLDTKGAVRVTAFQDCDISVRHPESFAAMQDILTS